MNLTLLCRRVIFGAVIAMLLFDLYLAAFGGPGSTISLQLFNLTLTPHSTLIFAFGYLAGHIFGRIDDKAS